MTIDLDGLTDRIAAGQQLAADQTEAVFESLVLGQLNPAAVERYLRALAARGESVADVVGAARVLRRHVTPVTCPDADAIDTCGTGGDGISTFNVSTAAAFVAAGAGVTVAKHGNRTHTRRSGSADVLEALGVRTDLPPAKLAECLQSVGIAFLHAARLHPAMAAVAPIRRAIAAPTLFNFLGPLANPAGVRRQIVGVPRPALVPMIAAALQQLGAIHAWVVYGDDGLCDLTATTTSRYIEVRDGRAAEGRLAPEDVGLPRAALADLLVDGPAASAAVIRAVLNGAAGPARDHTLLNAAAALVVAGRADTLARGVTMAADSIDSGRARARLDALIEFTRG